MVVDIPGALGFAVCCCIFILFALCNGRGAYCFTKVGSLTESELYTASGLTFNISSNSTGGPVCFGFL